MRNLESKETIDGVSAIWYKHDVYHLRKMGCPKDEYDGWAKHLIKRLEFERSFRIGIPLRREEGKLISSEVRQSFTFEEILEQIGRTFDFYNNLDGSISEMFKFENDKYSSAGYTSSELKPCNRFEFEEIAKDIYEYLVEEKEISLDPSVVDEKYCDSLRKRIKEVMEEQGYTWEDIELDGQWSLDNMGDEELNSLLFEIDPPAFLVGDKNRIDEED